MQHDEGIDSKFCVFSELATKKRVQKPLRSIKQGQQRPLGGRVFTTRPACRESDFEVFERQHSAQIGARVVRAETG